MKHAAIIGGTGYGAIELVRLLQMHRHIKVTKIISQSREGESLEKVYPHLHSFFDQPMELYDAEQLKKEVDIIFFATPSGVSKEAIPHFLDSGIQCIDLSGDLRLAAEDYEEWYHKSAASAALLDKTVFGLSEIYKEEISHANIIANPGCYPTAALLGLIPAVKAGVIEKDTIIIDAKSGVSGAGSSLSEMTHYSEMNENMVPYKFGKHQHIPEIERYLAKEAGEKINVVFSTHLVPVTRGLLCTMYGRLSKKMTIEEIVDLYEKFYQEEPFVRIQPAGAFPTMKQVAGSNFCDIGIHVDTRTNQLVIVSVIDNLVKGAAGQAIQNANLMNGWEVWHGLTAVPLYP